MESLISIYFINLPKKFILLIITCWLFMLFHRRDKKKKEITHSFYSGCSNILTNMRKTSLIHGDGCFYTMLFTLLLMLKGI